MGIIFHVHVKSMCLYLRCILVLTSGIVTKKETFEEKVRGRIVSTSTELLMPNQIYCWGSQWRDD